MDVQITLNTYKKLEADKLFLKNLIIGGSMEDIEGGQRPMVLPYNADLIRARQLYLRSYTFTRSKKKTLTKKTKLFLIKEKNYLQMKIAMLVSLFSSPTGRSEVL
ncbi:hypothetical protein L1987_66024 [Smallanthus sonchifolius]|uniref:Uncharacterized protein n=1 Tax=Smallanthus sonchifolius TaxID=185202 RepID=A0ACB9BVY7_9ASTR|nr:hypothetical protein L1987_66024 [Smallanthus sonchifolius]